MNFKTIAITLMIGVINFLPSYGLCSLILSDDGHTLFFKKNITQLTSVDRQFKTAVEESKCMFTKPQQLAVESLELDPSEMTEQMNNTLAKLIKQFNRIKSFNFKCKHHSIKAMRQHIDADFLPLMMNNKFDCMIICFRFEGLNN